VFDNIPLTALALKQGGYDWGFLAYCVGFGGSMIWFGSSAGVAISNMYPEAKSVGLWLRHGWFVAVSYIVAFFVMFAIVGWNQDAPHKKRVELDMKLSTVCGWPSRGLAPAPTECRQLALPSRIDADRRRRLSDVKRA
jgi:hypothetical protein